MVKKIMVLVLVFLLTISCSFMFSGCSFNNSDESNKNGSGNVGSSASMYLGAGYNVITSSYFNQTDAKVVLPILNMNKMSSYVKVDAETSNLNKSETILGKSITEYMEKSSASASVSGGVSFIRSFETSFGMSYSSETTTNQTFITYKNILTRKRDFFYDCDTLNLAKNVADSFMNAVENKSAEELIEIYGTHVLTDVLLGGRYELNYLYENSSSISESEINASVSASSRLLSGSATMNDEDVAKKVLENSSINFLSYGGVGSDTTSLESATNTYQNWISSLDNTTKISFVDCNQMVPLWELIAKMEVANAQDKADAVKAQFESLAAIYASKIKKPVAINTKPLVKNIYVEAGDNEQEAKDKLQGHGVPLSNILNMDLNSDAGGDYVYFGWTTTTDPAEAIRGIYGGVFSAGSGGRGSILVKGLYYTRWSTTDLNSDAGGADIYLYCSKDKRAGAPITDFAYKCNNTNSKSLTNYMAVLAEIGGSYRALDVNYDSGGDYVYIYYTR